MQPQPVSYSGIVVSLTTSQTTQTAGEHGVNSAYRGLSTLHSTTVIQKDGASVISYGKTAQGRHLSS